MHTNIDDLKNDLKELCIEYINILEKLKNEGIISDQVYKDCSGNKIEFLQE